MRGRRIVIIAKGKRRGGVKEERTLGESGKSGE